MQFLSMAEARAEIAGYPEQPVMVFLDEATAVPFGHDHVEHRGLWVPPDGKYASANPGAWLTPHLGDFQMPPPVLWSADMFAWDEDRERERRHAEILERWPVQDDWTAAT